MDVCSILHAVYMYVFLISEVIVSVVCLIAFSNDRKEQVSDVVKHLSCSVGGPGFGSTSLIWSTYMF